MEILKYKINHKLVVDTRFDARIKGFDGVECALDDGLAQLRNNILSAMPGFMYDGGSGPTVDTYDTYRGTLIHDILYRLMRNDKIPYKKYRKAADIAMRIQLTKDAKIRYKHSCILVTIISRLRPYVWYWAVRWFGESSASPVDNGIAKCMN